MTFYAGQERCQRLGGHLAHVNSLREQLFLEDFLKQILHTIEQQGSFLQFKVIMFTFITGAMFVCKCVVSVRLSVRWLLFRWQDY